MASTRRPALALPGPKPARLALRPRRVPLVLVGILLAAGLAYLGARETSVFAVRDVVVSGATGDLARSVRQAARPLVGESLAAVSPGQVERRLAALPGVLSASVERDFPHALRISVRPERPAAVLRRGAEAWLISARGRVIRQIEPKQLLRLPRLWLPPRDTAPAPGTVLLDDEGGALVRALAHLPQDLPGRVVAARGTPDSLVLALDGGCELRLGAATDLRLKLAVAATVLAGLPAGERRTLGYLDVSVPERVVAGPTLNSLPELESTA